MITFLWIVSRGAAVAADVLLGLSILLGIAVARGWKVPGVPRYTFLQVHRSISIAALGAVLIHILTLLFDPWADLDLLDLFVPFRSGWWIGLGTCAFDIMLAIIVTSLLRQRIPEKLWSFIHLSAYALFPLGVAHGLGAGTDSQDFFTLVVVIFITACVAFTLAYHLLRRPDRAFT